MDIINVPLNLPNNTEMRGVRPYYPLYECFHVMYCKFTMAAIFSFFFPFFFLTFFALFYQSAINAYLQVAH